MGGKSSIEYHRAYRAKNRERLLALKAAWRARNREAIRDNHRAWSSQHREQLRARSTEYREKNRDACKARVARCMELRGKEYQAKYLAKHPGIRSAWAREWRARNKERIQAVARAWAEQNRDRLAKRSANRRALKFRAIPAWHETEQVARLYAAARWLTQVTGEEYHVDHIVPLNSKLVCGLHCFANLQILPARENLAKGNRTWPHKEFPREL